MSRSIRQVVATTRRCPSHQKCYFDDNRDRYQYNDYCFHWNMFPFGKYSTSG